MAQFYEGSPAVSSEQAPLKVLRQGTSTILATAFATALIPDAQLTSTSVVICWGLGALDGNPATPTGARTFCVDTVAANSGFVIRSQAAAVADKQVGWAILKY
jgi:hypothetical protein